MRKLALILPGLLVAATGVGAGDLATAGFAGWKLGVGVFWAVLFGAALKWALSEGLARWQIATGTTLLECWVRRLKLQWVLLVYLAFWSFAVGGALISAAGVAGSALLPLGEDPVASKRVWGVLHSLVALVLVRLGGFKVFERVMAVCVGVMFVTVLYCAARLAPDVDWSMVRFVSPIGLGGEGRTWVLGLIGGVGGTLTLLSYGYWIREENRSGLAGVRVCRIDLAVAYLVTAFFGVAMLLIASTVGDLEGRGAQLIQILGDRLGDSMGDGLRLVFLLGAWSAIFSSMLGVWQSVPYMFADFVSVVGHRELPSDYSSSRPYKLFMLFLALPPIATLWLEFETIQLLYTVMGAFFMPLLAATLLIMNNHKVWIPREYRSGILVNTTLVLTVAFFVWQGYLQLAGLFGD